MLWGFFGVVCVPIRLVCVSPLYVFCLFFLSMEDNVRNFGSVHIFDNTIGPFFWTYSPVVLLFVVDCVQLFFLCVFFIGVGLVSLVP